MRRHHSALLACALFAALCSGCGASSDNAVPVQSVGMLCGLTETMQQQIFAGIVSTGNEANIKKDSNKKVGKVYVKKGDTVKAGDVLFTYDAEQAQNALEKSKLELEEQQNGLQSKMEEKYQLEQDKQKANADSQLEYTLKIQEMDTDIRETQYNIALKEKEIQSLEDATKDLDVKAPFDGIIEKAGQADTSTYDLAFGDDEGEGEEEDDFAYDDFDVDDEDSSSGDSFIKLVEADNYRIKGTINESNIDVIQVGMDMVIHSRVDENATWKGFVDSIDYKNPSKKSSSGYSDEGEDSEMTSSSNYPFYVKIDGLEGLMIGQHVYMTEDLGDANEGDLIRLSSNFINDPDAEAWVWAEKDGVLEKRAVVLGGYTEDDDTYIVESGLTADDYIAVPSDTYKEGMPVTENDLIAFENGSDGSADEGTESGYDGEDGDFDGEDFDDEDFGDEGFDDGDFDDADIEFFDDDADIGDEDFDDEEFDDGFDDEEMTIEERYQAAGEEIVG